jgi:hypothetical protein
LRSCGFEVDDLIEIGPAHSPMLPGESFIWVAASWQRCVFPNAPVVQVCAARSGADHQ